MLFLALFVCQLGARKTKFVFIVTSYNNASYYMKNLFSLLRQTYTDFRIIYVDDCSPDGTADLVSRYLVDNNPTNIPVLLLRQPERKRKMYNFYYAMQFVEDEEVAIDMDGDDWLVHRHVLEKLNQIYQDPRVWVTYGNYVAIQDKNKNKGYCFPFEPSVIEKNAYRDVPPRTSHLKTFYAWLFKKIDVADFMDNGQFLSSTSDYAIMFPLLELSGGRFKYVPEIWYMYNSENPIMDWKVNGPLQKKCFNIIKKKKRYNSVSPDQVPYFLR
jgi:glycosyltransferase involved in cell wall biosynthesis